MVLPDILSRTPVGRVSVLIGLFGSQADGVAWSSFGLTFHPTRHRRPKSKRWLTRRSFSFRGSWSRVGSRGQEFWSMKMRRPNQSHSLDAGLRLCFSRASLARASDAHR